MLYLTIIRRTIRCQSDTPSQGDTGRKETETFMKKASYKPNKSRSFSKGIFTFPSVFIRVCQNDTQCGQGVDNYHYYHRAGAECGILSLLS